MITNFLGHLFGYFFNNFSFSLQGDYIKHPVLYELSHKYGFPDNFPESSLSNRLEEIKEVIRREIRKELKVRSFPTKPFRVFLIILKLKNILFI